MQNKALQNRKSFIGSVGGSIATVLLAACSAGSEDFAPPTRIPQGYRVESDATGTTTLFHNVFPVVILSSDIAGRRNSVLHVPSGRRYSVSCDGTPRIGEVFDTGHGINFVIDGGASVDIRRHGNSVGYFRMLSDGVHAEMYLQGVLSRPKTIDFAVQHHRSGLQPMKLSVNCIVDSLFAMGASLALILTLASVIAAPELSPLEVAAIITEHGLAAAEAANAVRECMG